MRTLGWKVRVDNKGFIEAYVDESGLFFTWPAQMISVIIADNTILFNSIGDVDTYATQAFTWWKHARNIKQFKKTFDLFATAKQSR